MNRNLTHHPQKSIMNEDAPENIDPSEAATPSDAAEIGLQARVDQLEKQVHDYKLLIAEFENSRRRLLQDAEKQRKFMHEPMAKDLLPVFDTLDRALQTAEQAGETGALLNGVKATMSQFIDALKRHKITVVETTPGTPFNPDVHDALMQQPSAEHEPGSILQVVQHGFMFHDRVLRPARVIVATEA